MGRFRAGRVSSPRAASVVCRVPAGSSASSWSRSLPSLATPRFLRILTDARERHQPRRFESDADPACVYLDKRPAPVSRPAAVESQNSFQEETMKVRRTALRTLLSTLALAALVASALAAPARAQTNKTLYE